MKYDKWKHHQENIRDWFAKSQGNWIFVCQNNILYQLEYCDIGGLNQSLPPDILHAVLIGYVTRLLNGFAQLTKDCNDFMFVFSDTYKEEVERDLLSAGRIPSKNWCEFAKNSFP